MNLEGTELILFGLTLAFGFYMAWSIGANDVANAMGTSVGSGALTLKRAVIIAAVLEFAGAFLVGSHVTETVSKNIIDLHLFDNDQRSFMLGMLAALFAAGAWLQLASYFGWPVSTTHSIIGAIVGFGAVYGGLEAVRWSEVGTIVASWVVSPLLAGIVSYLIFRLLLRRIFYTAHPVAAAKRMTPYLVFCVFFILTFVMIFKGLKNLNLHLSFNEATVVAAIVGIIAGVISHFYIRKRNGGDTIDLGKPFHEQSVERGLRKARKHLNRVKDESAPEISDSIDEMLGRIDAITRQIETSKVHDKQRIESEHDKVERIFVFLQILSAAFVAFAHGANDVANAIGPMAAIISTLRTGVVAGSAEVPMWALALGGAGIVVGLATWGWRVIETIGKRITELTPTRGFSAEFGAATTIVIASRLGLPISTTHTLVGAVLGVGMARGMSALNLNTVRDIIVSWLVTLPAGAALAIVAFYALRAVLGA